MKHFYLSSFLALSILVSLGSGCIAQSSQSTSLEESNQSESKQDIPTTDQKEPVPVSKPTESPIQPMSYWAIPFLSTQEAHQLYQMLDEDSKANAKELVGVYGVQVVDQPLTFKECQDYFGEGGLFEHAKKVTFKRSQIDVECFEKLPKTLKDLALRKNQFMHESKIEFSEQTWVKVLESIADNAPHLQNLNINVFSRDNRSCSFQEKATAVVAKKMTSLRHLTIEAFIKKEAVREIAQGNLTQLTHLDLSGNFIGSEGFKDVVAGNLANLTYLDVSVNNIKDEAFQAISENLTQLRHLNLSLNKIGPKGAEAVALGNLRSLTHLDLSWNKIESEGARAITHGNLANLTHLDISWNSIDKEGIQAINENLLPRLASLDLSGNIDKENSSANHKIFNKLFKYLWE